MSLALNVKTVLFQTIPFSSIWSIDRTLSGATTPGQSEPGCEGNKGVLRILESFSITGTLPSDCLTSYPGHSWWGSLTLLQRCIRCISQPQPTGLQDTRCGSLTSAEIQTMYSTANWASLTGQGKNNQKYMRFKMNGKLVKLPVNTSSDMITLWRNIWTPKRY